MEVRLRRHHLRTPLSAEFEICRKLSCGKIIVTLFLIKLRRQALNLNDFFLGLSITQTKSLGPYMPKCAFPSRALLKTYPATRSPPRSIIGKVHERPYANYVFWCSCTMWAQTICGQILNFFLAFSRVCLKLTQVLSIS